MYSQVHPTLPANLNLATLHSYSVWSEGIKEYNTVVYLEAHLHNELLFISTV